MINSSIAAVSPCMPKLLPVIMSIVSQCTKQAVESGYGVEILKGISIVSDMS